jgi:hypothetical protein
VNPPPEALASGGFCFSKPDNCLTISGSNLFRLAGQYAGHVGGKCHRIQDGVPATESQL